MINMENKVIVGALTHADLLKIFGDRISVCKTKKETGKKGKAIKYPLHLVTADGRTVMFSWHGAQKILSESINHGEKLAEKMPVPVSVPVAEIKPAPVVKAEEKKPEEAPAKKKGAFSFLDDF